MSSSQRHALFLGAGLLFVAGLVAIGRSPAANPFAWLLFTALFIFTSTFGIPLGGGSVNLMPVAAIGGLLVMGPIPAVWMALIGSFAHAALRWRFAASLGLRREPGGWLPVLGLGAANTLILSLSLLGAAALYRAAGGALPLDSLALRGLPAYILLVLAFAALNYALAAAYIFISGGRPALPGYLAALPRVALYEITPQIFTPLLPLVYFGLGGGPFALFVAAGAAAALATRALALGGRRLEQRVAELNALGALGQALAGSLQVDHLLAAIRDQLPVVMPADGLFVALYDANTGEVSFPLIVEDGRRLEWPTRRAGKGLTEHVLRTRQPLLISDDVESRMQALGLAPTGRRPISWLGVPILAGSQLLGVLTVQAFNPRSARFTPAQRDLLATVAAQLALALTNARLYAQTDDALARRLQQLTSILETTREGILLLDRDTNILTVNRALAEFAGLAPGEIGGRLAETERLLHRLGTSPAELEEDLAALRAGRDLVKRAATIGGPAPRIVERTLAAVRDSSGGAAGWLLILRDQTEERALQQLREDLAHMLIHDLRGPLSSLITSLALVRQVAGAGQPLPPEALELLEMGLGSGRQLLRLVNQLLEIARLEAGALPLDRQAALPADLVAVSGERLRPAASSLGLRLVVDPAPGLLPVSVDVELIGRVLDNLTDNALKFAPSGSTVTLWARPGLEAGQVLFGITDQGPGIPAEAQASLFEKFSRVTDGPPNAPGRRQGTGLGLAFCRLVVEAHGGRIGLTSQRGQGATFYFSLATGAEPSPAAPIAVDAPNPAAVETAGLQ